MFHTGDLAILDVDTDLASTLVEWSTDVCVVDRFKDPMKILRKATRNGNWDWDWDATRINDTITPIEQQSKY